MRERRRPLEVAHRAAARRQLDDEVGIDADVAADCARAGHGDRLERLLLVFVLRSGEGESDGGEEQSDGGEEQSDAELFHEHSTARAPGG